MAERLYRISVAAELAGVSEGLLRAWERRFGLVKPRRTSGGYRAYSQRDIELVKRMKQLTEEGLSIGEAAKLAPSIRRALEASGEVPPPVVEPLASDQAALAGLLAAALAAAERVDQPGVEAAIDAALARVAPLAAWDAVLRPLEVEVGDRWHAGKLTSTQEHVVSNVVRARLLGLLHAAPSQVRRHVVCACFPEEQHELGLLQVALRFRHAGDRVTFVGARAQAPQLGQLVRLVKADLVALSAVIDPGAAAFRAALGEVTAALPDVRVIIGGAAALRNREVCAEAGVELVASEEDWARVLR
jgi:MerR family transcriptional regulator, light-induced transcriptional regulator